MEASEVPGAATSGAAFVEALPKGARWVVGYFGTTMAVAMRYRAIMGDSEDMGE